MRTKTQVHRQGIHGLLKALPGLFLSLVVVLIIGCGENLTVEERIELAREAREAGETQGAIVQLKNALQQDPGSAEARFLLGQVYLETGQGAEAEKELERSKELGLVSDPLIIGLGEALLLQGKYQRVVDEIIPIELETQDTQAQALRIVADAHRGLGNLEQSCDFYQDAADLQTAHVPAYWGLAFCASAQGEQEKARQRLQTAIEIDGTNARSWVLLGDLENAVRNTDAAAEAYSTALQQDPQNVQALYNRASLYLFTGKPDAAEKDIEKLRGLAGGGFWAQLAEGWLQFGRGEIDQALDLALQVNRAQPDYPPGLLLLGALQYEKQAYQQAIQALNQYLRRIPGNTGARKLLAATYMQIGQSESALQLLKPHIDAGQADAQMLALAGRAYLQEDAPSSAEEVYLKAIELLPANPALQTELGLIRLAAGRDAEAVETLRASSAADPGEFRADAALAYYYINRQQFDEAMEVIDILEEKIPDSPGPHNLRGVVYMAKNDPGEARKSFEKALSLNPDLTSASIRLAALDLRDKNYDAARQRYESILERDGKNIPAMIGLAEMAAAREDEAGYLEWLNKAVEANPAALPPRIMITNYHLGKNQTREALSTAKATVEARPDSPEALSLVGNVQLRAGDTGAAIQNFVKVVELIPNSADARFNLARAYTIADEVDKARGQLRELLKVTPEYTQARIALAEYDKRIGDREGSIAFARQLQQIAPNSPTGYILEGEAEATAGNHHRAAENLEKALSLEEDRVVLAKLHQVMIQAEPDKADEKVLDWIDSNPEDIRMRLFLADSYTKRARVDDAIQQYEAVVELDRNNIMALNNLANLYLEKSDDRALATARRARDLAPEQPSVNDTLGWVLVQNGQAAEGLEVLEKAAEASPENSHILYHLAFALNETGEEERAREIVRQLENSQLDSGLKEELAALKQKLR